MRSTPACGSDGMGDGCARCTPRRSRAIHTAVISGLYLSFLECRMRVAANGRPRHPNAAAALGPRRSGAEASAVTRAFRRAPAGVPTARTLRGGVVEWAGRGQDPVPFMASALAGSTNRTPTLEVRARTCAPARLTCVVQWGVAPRAPVQGLTRH